MASDKMGIHIAIVGDPINGFEFFGLFATGDDATEWATGEYPVAGDPEWQVAPLRYPTVTSVNSRGLEIFESDAGYRIQRDDEFALFADDDEAVSEGKAAVRHSNPRKKEQDADRRRHDEISRIAPHDATHYRNGSFYKIGVRGLVFRFCDREWVRPSLRPAELIGHEIARSDRDQNTGDK